MEFQLESWLSKYTALLLAAFADRLLYVGLQGSRARGEARPDSDIDMVVVLDNVGVDDLKTYRKLLAGLPFGELACGFFCGAGELRRWPRHDLLQLALDTKSIHGDLSGLIPDFTHGDTAEAVRVGAAALYHGACHGYLYGGDRAEALSSLLKSVFFLLRMDSYRTTGRYVSTKAELRPLLDGDQRELLDLCGEPQRLAAAPGELDRWYGILLRWSGGLLDAQ